VTAEAHQLKGLYLGIMRRFDEALEELELARDVREDSVRDVRGDRVQHPRQADIEHDALVLRAAYFMDDVLRLAQCGRR